MLPLSILSTPANALALHMEADWEASGILTLQDNSIGVIEEQFENEMQRSTELESLGKPQDY